MLLVIDVGNTNIVAGVFDNRGKLKDHWRFSTDRSKTADEFGILLCGTFGHKGIKTKDVDGIIISSVVPPVLVPVVHMCERYFGLTPVLVGPGTKSGIAVHYDNPREVGADRIVNAASALHKYGKKGKPMIVIDFGTATTFDALLPTGDYLGGAIAPGIGISSEALFSRTAKLPRIELLKPRKVICRNTVRSMQSGIMYGYVGLMEGIVSRMKKELGDDAYVIATGGFAHSMAAESKMIDVVEPFLTLDGLRILYMKNKE
ncbi:MAG: type III pantothenate kinase [Acidaminococcaceae bacterium]|nr:type III pantothenate kinase [Acidaminococcaceae bacterium]